MFTLKKEDSKSALLEQEKKSWVWAGVLCSFLLLATPKVFLTFCFSKRKLHRKLKSKSEILWNKEQKVVTFEWIKISVSRIKISYHESYCFVSRIQTFLFKIILKTSFPHSFICITISDFCSPFFLRVFLLVRLGTFLCKKTTTNFLLFIERTLLRNKKAFPLILVFLNNLSPFFLFLIHLALEKAEKTKKIVYHTLNGDLVFFLHSCHPKNCRDHFESSFFVLGDHRIFFFFFVSVTLFLFFFWPLFRFAPPCRQPKKKRKRVSLTKKKKKRLSKWSRQFFG